MSDYATVSLLTNELRDYWRNLLSEIIGANIDVFNGINGDQLIQQMKDVQNKLALVTLTQERDILAVTGLQGAGKTTVVKRLYDLDDSFLPENLSRGEQLPVLITESKVQSPEGYLYYSSFEEENGFQLKSRKVDSQEFNRIAKEPGTEDVWLELKVPYKYFQGSSEELDHSHANRKSLALLPGFEKDQNEKSQQLLYHLLYLSTSSVVVFRKDTYAREASERMFKRVKDIYKNVKPIFVLSHGDINPEQNQHMHEQMVNDFGIEESETDRIIISGDPTTYKEPWIEQLMKSIQTYGYITEESEQKKVRLLEQLFNEIRVQIELVEELLKKHEENKIINSKGLSSKDSTYRLVHQFETFYEKVLKELEASIKSDLEKRTPTVRKNFNQFVQKNTGFLQNLTSKFSANALKEQEKLQEAIEDSWIYANQEKPEGTIVNVVTDYIHENDKGILQDPASKEVAPSQLETKDPLEEFNIEGLEELDLEDVTIEGFESITEPTFEKMEITQAGNEGTSLQKINAFFNKEEKDSLIVLERDDIKNMVIIGTMIGRQSLVAQPLLQQLSNRSKITNTNVETYRNSLDKTVNDVDSFSSNVKQLGNLSPTILKSIPLVLGIDIALDGEADLINHVVKALNAVGLPIVPLQLVSVIGAGLALTYGVNAIQKAVQETNKRQLELAQAGHHAIEQLPALQTKAFITAQRRIFEKMADQLYEVHSEKLGKFDDDGTLERIQYQIRRIKNMNGQVQKMVYQRAGFII
ncbi:hypothetical protein [Bacillus solitudinis]|uniref:hypothetical protein n=1 Tax=Bacillus solitudinis TaxID=2014074 RepID=UPI000C23D6F3|nr:hypothetical protein [Bacillus solitudinis]